MLETWAERLGLSGALATGALLMGRAFGFNLGAVPGAALGCFLAAALSGAAQAEPIQARQVTPTSWFVQGEAALGSVANRNFISNAGFVVTSQGVVVIDALGSPALARELVAEIRRLTAQPIRYVVVTHAEGVDMLMEGAKSANGTEYAPLVSALKSRGVTFEICEITLKSRGLKKDQFIQEADFTPSGVVRIAKLQLQGYAYIKP